MVLEMSLRFENARLERRFRDSRSTQAWWLDILAMVLTLVVFTNIYVFRVTELEAGLLAQKNLSYVGPPAPSEPPPSSQVCTNDTAATGGLWKVKARCVRASRTHLYQGQSSGVHLPNMCQLCTTAAAFSCVACFPKMTGKDARWLLVRAQPMHLLFTRLLLWQ